MPGVIYRALQMTKFDWSPIPASNSNTKLYVARAVDVSAYREVTVIGRIHTISISPAGASPSVIINAIPEAPTAEDPALEFLDTAHQTALNFGTLNNTTTGPLLTEALVSTPFGGWLRIQLNPTQSVTQATTFSVTLSIDIVAKS